MSFEDHALKAYWEHNPVIMGIVNVTPDSFSDGGKFLNYNNAIEHGAKLLQDGASIIDIGGESTRPGSQHVDVKEEMERVIPVIEGLVPIAKNYKAAISIDTRNAATMQAALESGANIVNDISALEDDSNSVQVVKTKQVPVILMHKQGQPTSMQDKPSYNNVVEDIFEYLQERIKYCETHRIDKNMIIIDPGIGFGKTIEHNLLILRNIKKFIDLGVPVMLGASRKSFIGQLSENEASDERLAGSLSSALYAYQNGVKIFRVHDVAETKQALCIYDAITKIEAKN